MKIERASFVFLFIILALIGWYFGIEDGKHLKNSPIAIGVIVALAGAGFAVFVNKLERWQVAFAPFIAGMVFYGIGRIITQVTG